VSAPSDPLLLEYATGETGPRVVRQPAPAGAATSSATYIAPAGWAFDPAGERGTARLVNELVVSAAGRWNRVELARRLDRAGATLSTETSPESAEVTVWGPAADWEALLGVLAEVVLRPRFDAADFARGRRQFQERQIRERTHPAARAHAELLRGIFPAGHPYRETGIGDARALARLSRGGLARFHRARYGSTDALVIVTTHAGLGAVERAVRRRFRDLPEGRRGALSWPALGRRPPRRIEVDLPGRSQVEVRVGGASIPQSSPQYPGAFLSNQALGGRPLISRLFQSVRERTGLAYGASSRLETMRFGGWWVAGAGTGSDRWRRVVPMVEREVARMRLSELPAAELHRVRESSIGEIPLALESTAEAHELAVDAAYHELPADFWIQWPKRLRAVTRGEARAGARAAFDDRRSVTVVVGPLHGT
jgi:zinc protease